MVTNPTTPQWPQTPEDEIDWEIVFEHPDTGFIPLIMQAPSAAALRKSTIFIIRSIYGDDTSEIEIDDFITEINSMLPDEVPVEMLPKLADAVASILRDIKIDRIHRSVAPPEPRPAPGPPPRGAVKKSAEKTPAFARIIALLFVMAFVGGGGGYGIYHYAFKDNFSEETLRAHRLIVEMEAASRGEGPETHEFGWPLTVEHRAGLIGVTATGLPLRACFSAAWHFVNVASSIVIINVRLPERTDPGILKRFCSERGRTAKLLWLSKDPAASDEEPTN